MTKKFLSLMIACLLVVCIMEGCTTIAPTETTGPIETSSVHTHVAGAEWQ